MRVEEPVRDSTSRLLALLRSHDPVAVVWYESASVREELMSRIEALAPDERPLQRTRSVDAAFTQPSTLLLLAPEDEPSAIEKLDGRREALRERRVPVVLFLLRGGEALRRLAGTPGLASWIQGRDLDPAALDRVDVAQMREEFLASVGMPPEEWLARFRDSRIPDTVDSNLIAQRATLLEGKG